MKGGSHEESGHEESSHEESDVKVKANVKRREEVANIAQDLCMCILSACISFLFASITLVALWVKLIFVSVTIVIATIVLVFIRVRMG